MLSANERRLLYYLTMDPFVSQQEMADRIGLSRPAVANILSRLTDKGYIVGRQYLLNHEQYIMCVGGANVDRALRLQSPMKQETSNPVRGSESYGGVARNVGENLGRLGSPAALLTLVGRDRHGDQLLYDASANMNVFPTEKLAEYNTGSYIAVLDQAGDLVVGFADMEITLAMNAEWIHRHNGHLNLCNWVLADCNVQADAMAELVRRAREKESNLAIIGVSSAKIHRIPKNLHGVRILICNQEESMAYFGTDETSTEALCRMWLKTGVASAVVTAGAEPYAYGEGDHVESVPVRRLTPEKVVDVTGAGDAFCAGILYALIQDKPLKEAVRYGEANSRLTLAVPEAVRKDLCREILLEEMDNESVSGN